MVNFEAGEEEENQGAEDASSEIKYILYVVFKREADDTDDKQE